MSQRILVTGATGFIGRFLIEHLVGRGDTAVIALLRDNYNLAKLPPYLAAVRSQVELVYADLRNLQLTVRAVEEAEPDVVIHLAAAGVTEPFLGVETAVRHNLTASLNLIRACFEKRFNTEQLIVARTPGELSSMNVYAASKAAAWQFCQMYARTQGWPIHGGMIFQAYGPGQPARNLLPAALAAAQAGEDFPMTAGTQQRDWIYAADVAEGLAAIIGSGLQPGQTVDLGTGVLTSVAEVVRQIYGLVGGAGRPLIGVLPSRPGEEAVQVADVARTQRLIGWQAGRSLLVGLREMVGDGRPL
ncbi:MAG: NAD(P)-dependent oxidoreductase [Ardenticatenaceae bacterium]|nr:NAD(P)-dependent oxidoreductase [Ardenticatenaceae bacterium]